MQQSQLNQKEKEDPEKDNPALSKVIERNIRTILHLRFYTGLTQSQIAQQVGISQMHVSRLIRRALEKIRVEIASDEEPERVTRTAG